MSSAVSLNPPSRAAPRGLPWPSPLVVVDMVWPDQSNHHGTLFGGAGMAMLDRMAFILGSKALRGSVVTAAVSPLDFASPAPAGHLVECRASVLRRGRRSVVVDTRLVAEDLLSGARTDCLGGAFTMVRQAGTGPEGADAAEPADPAHAAHPGASPEGAPDAAPPPVDEAGATTWVTEIVFPGHTNHRGLLHGGPAMAWIAKAGFVAASRHVRRTVVMACSERLDFVASARTGEVVEVGARVVGMGRRSVQVAVSMWAESPTTGQRRLCTEARLVYVVVDD